MHTTILYNALERERYDVLRPSCLENEFHIAATACPILEPRGAIIEKVSLPVLRVYICAHGYVLLFYFCYVRRRRLETHIFLSKVNGRRHAAHATQLYLLKSLKRWNHGKLAARVYFCDQTD